ncbi:unnamed protein product [Durusdinium trenchii]|uniref:Uncharacterized protein n=1 Tax=Durusdinium trenchii TaxID=1381693 RepID=A0ABP0I5W2_9DINO
MEIGAEFQDGQEGTEPTGRRLPEAAGSRSQRTPLDLGAEVRSSARELQDRLGGSGRSLGWLEDEAPARWSRSFISPKAASEHLPRRVREDAARRELDLLEEKMMRQVLRLQEQSERFMDIMMHPLEAKVAALEGRQPVIDCSIAELRGNLKGIQDSIELQVRRSDQNETRMCKWRKTLEEQMHARVGEVSNRLGEGPSPSETVSRSEMVELAKVLKKELKKLVEEAFQQGHAVSREELAGLGTALREEIGTIEKLTADTAAQKLSAHQDLTTAAEAVREEMKSLTEKAIQEEALVRASMSAVQDLEKASQQSRRGMEIFERRMAKCEQEIKELPKRVMIQAPPPVDAEPGAIAPLEANHAPSHDSHDALLESRVALCEQLEKELQSDVQQQGHRLDQLEAQELSAALEKAFREVARLEQRLEELRVPEAEALQWIARCEEQVDLLPANTDLQDLLAGASTSGKVEEGSDLTEALKRMTRCEEQIEDFRKDLEKHQASEHILPKVEEGSDLTEALKRMTRCEEQIEDFRKDLEKHQASELILPKVEEGSDLTEALKRMTRCEEQIEDFRKDLEKHQASELILPKAEESSDLSDALKRMTRCEEQIEELRSLRREPLHEAATASQLLLPKASRPEHEDEAELSDIQLMLLDLQQRVSALEGAEVEGPEATSAAVRTPVAVLGQAAELIQKIESDLQQAREAVVPGLDTQKLKQLVDSKASAPARDEGAGTPRALPPLAAMKVMASPRLQRLSMTPRLQSALPEVGESELLSKAAAEFQGEMSQLNGSELRAEVAAVWDAVAELAEIVGDAAPAGAVRYAESSSLGALQQTATLAMEKAESCHRSMSSFGQQLRTVEESVQEMDSRLYGCERMLSEGSRAKEEVFATFDFSSFQAQLPERAAAPAGPAARVARAFDVAPHVGGRRSEGSSSHATISDVCESRPLRAALEPALRAAAQFKRYPLEHPVRRSWEEACHEATSQDQEATPWPTVQMPDEVFLHSLASCVARAELRGVEEQAQQLSPPDPMDTLHVVCERAKAALASGV